MEPHYFAALKLADLQDELVSIQRKIVYHESMVEDGKGGHKAHLTRLGRNAQAVREQIADLVSERCTGKPWDAFCRSVHQDYTPTVSAGEHGEFATVFVRLFTSRFGRSPRVSL
jgi:hypothetical protein